MKATKTQVWQMAGILLWGVLCWAFFQFCYPCHFFYQEQNQIFLLASDYLATYFSKPAWLACLAGDFLTQFYYYIYAGAVILTGVLLVTGDLVRRAMQRAGLGRGAAYVAAMGVMTLEALFCLSESHRLSSVLCVGGASLLWLLTPRGGKGFGGRLLGMAAVAVGTLLAHWCFGYGVWLYAALAMAGAWRRGRIGELARTAAATLTVIALLALTKPVYLLNLDRLYAYPGVGRLAQPAFALERLLAVDNAYYWGHDQRVMAMVEQMPADKRTLQMTFYYNLASARSGLLAQNLLKVQPTDLGIFKRIGPDTPTLEIFRINEVYYLLGDMTFAERAAMMTNVFSPDNRNVRMMKRLAEANLVNGDMPAAMKYLRLLSNTLAYRQWAEDRMPGRQTKAVREELARKRQFINTRDTLRLTDNAHVMMNELVESNPANEVAINYMLCSDLILNDLRTFWDDYRRFCLGKGRPRNETIYQEALLICLAAQQIPQQEWSRYITRPDVLRRFMDYNGQRGSSAFSDTYWYYYDKK